MEFLLEELVRQHQNLSESKTSLDSRSSFMLGLVGVILTLFSSVFVAYWTSTAAKELAIADSFAWWLSLGLTLAVMAALLFATLLHILVLHPREFGVGIDIIDAYEKASNPRYNLRDVREGTLRALIPNVNLNEGTYLSAVLFYKIGALVTVAALALAVEFVALLIAFSIGIEPMLREKIWVGFAFSVLLLTSIVAFRLVRILQSHRVDTLLLKTRMRQYDDLLRSLTSHSKP